MALGLPGLQPVLADPVGDGRRVLADLPGDGLDRPPRVELPCKPVALHPDTNTSSYRGRKGRLLRFEFAQLGEQLLLALGELGDLEGRRRASGGDGAAKGLELE